MSSSPGSLPATPNPERDPLLGKSLPGTPDGAACVTHEGYHREGNEDLGAVYDTPIGRVLIVCDGMGGHEGGEKAAEIAMEAFRRVLTSAAASANIQETLRHALSTANNDILAWRKTRPALRNMGSTAVVAVIRNHHLQVAHVGDSRAYLVRNGNLRRLTRDQTLVQDFIEKGHITEDQARSHPFGNALKQAVGQDTEPAFEFSAQIPMSKGDVVFLCSDGLSGYVKDSAIQKVISTGLREPQKLSEAFIALALAAGGQDNVTVAMDLKTDGPVLPPDDTQKFSVSAIQRAAASRSGAGATSQANASLSNLGAAVESSSAASAALLSVTPGSAEPVNSTNAGGGPELANKIGLILLGAAISYVLLVLAGALPNPLF